MPDEVDNAEHLAWLIESRHRNQKSALALLLLLREYDKFWKTKDLSVAAQELTSVCFSLWRAAFLADKTGRRSEVFTHGKAFLERVIEDNAVAYPQDKLMREWTFNYYSRSARFSLEYLNRRWPEISPSYEVTIRPSKIRWEYCQDLLEKAISGFGTHLQERQKRKSLSERKRAAKATKKKQRAIVRTMTLRAKK